MLAAILKIKRFTAIFFIALVSCKPSKSFYQTENDRIRVCRDNWKIDSLADKATIKLLLQDPKGRYDLSSWPNFFIGTTNLGDTIGIISYETNIIFDKGNILSFNSSRIRNLPLDELSSLSTLPAFKIHRRRIYNDLYCAVKKIYYGELVQ